jgi:hypothetical protein
VGSAMLMPRGQNFLGSILTGLGLDLGLEISLNLGSSSNKE